jgi:hypothetical protein
MQQYLYNQNSWQSIHPQKSSAAHETAASYLIFSPRSPGDADICPKFSVTFGNKSPHILTF